MVFSSFVFPVSSFLVCSQSTCVGFSNFSGDRNVSREVGSYCVIRLDLISNTITYITKHGERMCPIDCRGQALYAAVDSDENGDYKIEWDGPRLGGGGGGGSGYSGGGGNSMMMRRARRAEAAWRSAIPVEVKTARKPCRPLGFALLEVLEETDWNSYIIFRLLRKKNKKCLI